ncbi:ABC transporter permease [Eubacteriales bacterium OttesenSCG-928-A19]|nr:ABC transporter permease [Eubacteriales bacterium OttesenSCG-928-A19]
MRDYIIKRLAQGVLLVFCVSFLVFSMLYLMPGDPITHMVDPNISKERIEEIKVRYGLDRPLLEQYASWLKRIVTQRDFGMSYKNKLPVWDLIKVRIPVSLRLTGTIMFFQLIIAVPLGLLCAYKKDSLFDRVTVGISLLMTAVPQFWLSVLLILLFAVRLQWFPLSGADTARHYVLPVIAGVMSGIASTLRLTKTEALDVFRERYVLTAYAKGLPKRTVIVRHVLRNALILIVVIVFMSIPWLISGLVIIESIFAIPGMGNLLINSIKMQDFPIVQACMLIISTLTVLCNILSDLIIGMLDPRIRISISGGER